MFIYVFNDGRYEECPTPQSIIAAVAASRPDLPVRVFVERV